MQEPGSWIVLLECNGEETITWERCNVTAGWVDEIPLNGIDIEDGSLLSDDPEVVSVQMDRVSDSVSLLAWRILVKPSPVNLPNTGVVLNNVHCPFGVGNRERDNVVIRRPDGIIVEDLKGRWV